MCGCTAKFAKFVLIVFNLFFWVCTITVYHQGPRENSRIYPRICPSHPCSSHPCSRHPCSSHPCSNHLCSSHPCSSHPCSCYPMPQSSLFRHSYSSHHFFGHSIPVTRVLVTPFLVIPAPLTAVRAGNRSGSPNGFFNRLTMVRIGAVNFR